MKGKKLPRPVRERSKSSGIFTTIVRWFYSLLINRYHSIDEILNIIRPFIYVYSVIKFGRKSFKPIKISLLIDVIQTGFSLLRLYRSAREKSRLEKTDKALSKRRQHILLSEDERAELIGRIWKNLLKYCIREPVFESYTLPTLSKILTKLRVPQVIMGYGIAYLNYFKYYHFIA